MLVVGEDDTGLFGERLEELNVAAFRREAQQAAEIRRDKKRYRGYIAAVSIAAGAGLGSEHTVARRKLEADVLVRLQGELGRT